MSSEDGWDEAWNDVSYDPMKAPSQVASQQYASDPYDRQRTQQIPAGYARRVEPRMVPQVEPPRKKKGSKGLMAFAVLLLVAGAVAIGVAAYLFFSSQAEYKVGSEEYATLAEEAVVQDKATNTPTVDFAALTQQNPEIVGWVQIPGTIVNYPVAQHSDNDWYLEHTFLGQYNLAGSVFMDSRSSSSLNDYVTVLYGHHLKNGAMFAKVADYSDQAEFDTLGSVYYVTADGTLHTLEPLCTIVVSGYDETILHFSFIDYNDFSSYTQSLITRSTAHAANATPDGVTHLYILSTCSYATDNERTMLVCVERGDTAATGTQQQVADIQSAADEAAGTATDGEA